jgi:hypothetical protein
MTLSKKKILLLKVLVSEKIWFLDANLMAQSTMLLTSHGTLSDVQLEKLMSLKAEFHLQLHLMEKTGLK